MAFGWNWRRLGRLSKVRLMTLDLLVHGGHAWINSVLVVRRQLIVGEHRLSHLRRVVRRGLLRVSLRCVAHAAHGRLLLIPLLLRVVSRRIAGGLPLRLLRVSWRRLIPLTLRGLLLRCRLLRRQGVVRRGLLREPLVQGLTLLSTLFALVKLTLDVGIGLSLGLVSALPDQVKQLLSPLAPLDVKEEVLFKHGNLLRMRVAHRNLCLDLREFELELENAGVFEKGHGPRDTHGCRQLVERRNNLGRIGLVHVALHDVFQDMRPLLRFGNPIRILLLLLRRRLCRLLLCVLLLIRAGNSKALLVSD